MHRHLDVGHGERRPRRVERLQALEPLLGEPGTCSRRRGTLLPGRRGPAGRRRRSGHLRPIGAGSHTVIGPPCWRSRRRASATRAPGSCPRAWPRTAPRRRRARGRSGRARRRRAAPATPKLAVTRPAVGERVLGQGRADALGVAARLRSLAVSTRRTANSSPPYRQITLMPREWAARASPTIAQGLVTGGVAEVVVHHLEAVHVEQHHRDADG